jgi:hypothetical protein
MALDPTSNGGNMAFSASQGSPFAHLGQEANVAYDPRAPLDEVDDANGRLMKIYGATAGDSVSPDVYGLVQGAAGLVMSERHAEDVVAKAMRLRDGGGEPREGKAHVQAWGSDFGRGYFKWLPKRGVQLPVLRAFGRRLEVWQAILRTRKRQVDRFSRPSRAADQLGWRLSMADEDRNLGQGMADEIRWLTKVLECGGREFSPVKRRELRRQGMTTFLRNLIEDGLTLDNSSVELIGLNGSHGLDSWYVRPSETFALASPDFKDRLPDGRPVYAFQVLNGRAEVPFAFDELSIWIRNSSTWAEENGYGYSEFEQSLETLNNIIQAVTYTKQGLSENAIPRGILMAYGNYDIQTQNAFKAAWSAKVRGIQNQFNSPVLFSRGQQGGVQYLNTGEPFSEMAFAKWISFCMTVMGAIAGVDPSELGMESFTAEKSSLSGDDTGERLASAKDKGLNPLLKDAGGFISDEIVSRFNPDIRLTFTGLDADTSQEARKNKLMHMTINEVRAEYDLPEHPLAWFGNLPADPGQQEGEFKRMTQGATWGEFRRMVGLPEYPSPMMELAPCAPNLGALYNMSLSVPAEGADGEDPDNPSGEGEDPSSGIGGDMAGRMAALSGQDGAPFKTLDDMKAKVGIGGDE